MQGRYKIIRRICLGKKIYDRDYYVTDYLVAAVTLCEDLGKVYYGSPIVFDFLKVAPEVDEGYDYFPSRHSMKGQVFDCINMAVFKEQYAKAEKEKAQ